MSLHQTLKDEQHEQEEALSAKAIAADANRTDADRAYEKEIDRLIDEAWAAAEAEVGPKPPARDPLRIKDWEWAVNRIYLKNMDIMAEERGLRRSSSV